MDSPSGQAPHQTDASVVTFTRSIIVTGNTFTIVKVRRRGFSVCMEVFVGAIVSFTGLDVEEMVEGELSSCVTESLFVSIVYRLWGRFLWVIMPHESDDDNSLVFLSLELRDSTATHDMKHKAGTQ